MFNQFYCLWGCRIWRFSATVNTLQLSRLHIALNYALRSTASRGHKVLGIRDISNDLNRVSDHDGIWIPEAAAWRNEATEVNAPSNMPPQYSNEIEFILTSAVIPDFLHVYVGLVCQKYEIILLLLIPFAEILCNPGFEGLCKYCPINCYKKTGSSVNGVTWWSLGS